MLLGAQRAYKDKQEYHELIMGDGSSALATATVAHVLRHWLTIPSSSAVGRPPRHLMYMRYKTCRRGLTRGLLSQRAGREPKEQDRI